VVKSEPHQLLEQQAAQAAEHSLFVRLETYRCLLQAEDLPSQTLALDAMALQQTLEVPQLVELLPVERQASVDVHLEAFQQAVQDSPVQDKIALRVTLVEHHLQQV
jgi:hypothetical protein